MDQNNDNEVIGYGNPPKKSQFKKGVSGNPRGRPKGAKNLETYFEQEANQKVSVTENGKQIRIPKAQAIVKVMINKSLAGSDGAIANTLPRLERLDEKKEQARAAKGAGKLADEDREILRRFGWAGEEHGPAPGT